MALAPKQLQRDGARGGQALAWDGQKWTAGEDLAGLRALVEFQGSVIRALAETLLAERLRLPPAVEEYVNGSV